MTVSRLAAWLPHRRARLRDQRQGKADAQLNRLNRQQKAMRQQLKAANHQLKALRKQLETTHRRVARAVDLEGRERGRTRLLQGPYTYFVGVPRVDARGNGSSMVRIGSYCSIAEDVVFVVESDHRMDWVTTYPLRAALGLVGAWSDGHPATRGDIVVGHDVWIGRDARILSGVTVGDGAVVGASAVVTRDVRPYAIVVGNPAREVRRRFTDHQVQALEEIAWWHWPQKRIVAAVPLLCGGDVEHFITEHAERR